MPPRRELAGLSGDLYDRDSEAHHKSLETLLGVLMRAGFQVMKKKANETTLRAYPVKYRTYPLLNPGFEAEVPLPGRKKAKESLVFWVISQGDPLLQEYLSTLPSEGDCPFYVERQLNLDGDYVLHGRFVLPLAFKNQGEGCVIDFGAMRPALAHLRQMLQYRKSP